MEQKWLLKKDILSPRLFFKCISVNPFVNFIVKTNNNAKCEVIFFSDGQRSSNAFSILFKGIVHPKSLSLITHPPVLILAGIFYLVLVFILRRKHLIVLVIF